jgi:hypothetical protein
MKRQVGCASYFTTDPNHDFFFRKERDKMFEWINWKKVGLFAGGFLAGSYGVKLLSSKDAKTVYTHTTAAALRMKDTVMKDVTTLRENCEDIAAAAADINEDRQRQYDAQMIEDAKAILAQAQESGAEANA